MRLLAAALPALFAVGSACSGSHGDASPEPLLRLDRALVTDSVLSPEMAAGWADMASAMGFDGPHSDFASLPAVELFEADVERMMPPLDSVETVLGRLRANLAAELPRIGWQRTFAIVWPYNQSVTYGADGSVLVALNHYLGADYPGYKGRFPEYIAANKRPAMLPVDVAEALVRSEYGFTADPDTPPTLLSRMLHEGALILAMKSALPDGTPLDALLGISPEQARWLTDNEAAVWHTMMERQMVYNSDPALADRLLGRSPVSSAIGPEVPGRAATYIGLRIVEAYRRQNPDVTVSRMLSPDFYNSNQSLIDSRYAPSQQ